MSTPSVQPAMTFETTLESFYASGIAQFNAGNQEIVYPDNAPRTIITALCTRFAALFESEVTPIHYPDRYVIALKVSQPKKPQPKEKIPRPPNAFILYRTHHHQTIKKQNPGIANNDISKIIAGMWKSEAETAKDEWKFKAQEVKTEHSKNHPNYSYQPRRSSEKKRRMTKRRFAAIEEARAQMSASQSPSTSTSTPNELLEASPQAQLSVHDVIEMLPIRPDDPMIREFELPTSSSAINQFTQHLKIYNDSQALLPTQHSPVLESSFSESVSKDHSADLAQLDGLFDSHVSSFMHDPMIHANNFNLSLYPYSYDLSHQAFTNPDEVAAHMLENQHRMSAEQERQDMLQALALNGWSMNNDGIQP